MDRTESVLQALRSVALLRKLSDHDRMRLAGVLVEQHYGPGETVIRQGEESTGFYIVVRGDLIVTRRNKPTEKSVEIGRLSSGDFFGEAGLLSNAPRSATVSVAMTSQAECLFLDRQHFLTMFSTEHLNLQFAKRQGISGEDGKSDTTATRAITTKVPKDAVRTKSPLQHALILRAIQDNVLFSGLDSVHKDSIIKEMWRHAFRRGENAIVQDDLGDNIYIVESGEFGVFVNGNRVATRVKGTMFGELALLYNSPRKATVTALVDSVVWVVDRFTFRRIVTDLSERRFQLYIQFLQRVSLLQPLSQFERSKVAEALEEVTVKAGQVVCKQGSPGDCMYLVYSGTLVVTKTEPTNTMQSRLVTHSSSNSLSNDITDSLGPEFAAAASAASAAVQPMSGRAAYTSATTGSNVHGGSSSALVSAGSAILRVDTSNPTMTYTHFSVPPLDTSAPLAVNRISPGGYFGERALLKNEPRAATVTAETDCRLLRLDRNAFVLLLGPLQDIMKNKIREDEDFEQSVRSSPTTTPLGFTEPKRLGKYPSSMQLTSNSQATTPQVPITGVQDVTPNPSQSHSRPLQHQSPPAAIHYTQPEYKASSTHTSENFFMNTSSYPTTPKAKTTGNGTTSLASNTSSFPSAVGALPGIPVASQPKKLMAAMRSQSSGEPIATGSSAGPITGFETNIATMPDYSISAATSQKSPHNLSKQAAGLSIDVDAESDSTTSLPMISPSRGQTKRSPNAAASATHTAAGFSAVAPASTTIASTASVAGTSDISTPTPALGPASVAMDLSPVGGSPSNANARYKLALQAAGPAAQAKGLPWTSTTGVSKGFTPVAYSDLRVVGTLGKGSFGYVQLVQDTVSSQTFALKAVSKTQIVETSQQGHILSEKRTMLKLNHPFLVRLYQTFKDRNRLFFLLDPVLGGELFTLLRSKYHFDEDAARFYAAAVILGFEYMHDFNIVYRDLKPENLLLDADGYIKIADFGFAKDIGESGRTWTICGTPDYLAPEVVNSLGHGKGVDWWTLGVFIYEMLVAYPPFYDEDPMRTYARIVEGVVEYPTHLSSESVSLIRKLLVARPTKRLGVVKGGAKLIKIHRWFEDFDWNAMYNKQLPAPHVPNIRSSTDLSNFDQQHVEPTTFKPYVNDGSNWDEDF